MARWGRRIAVAALVVLAPTSVALGTVVSAAGPPGSDSTTTTTVGAPPGGSTTTTPSGSTTSTTQPSASASGTTVAPQKPKPSTTTAPPPTTAKPTTTTTIPARASGTWITAPGYNPAWHSINNPLLPRPPANSGGGRRIVYSKGQQRVWLMEANGYITNTHLVSGRYDIPAYGYYHVYSKSLHTFATHNPSIIWNYMVRFAVGPQGGGIGLHQIPTQYGRPLETLAQLGQPLSGGCVRQAPWDAILVWNWAPVGTLVVVVP